MSSTGPEFSVSVLGTARVEVSSGPPTPGSPPPTPDWMVGRARSHLDDLAWSHPWSSRRTLSQGLGPLYRIRISPYRGFPLSLSSFSFARGWGCVYTSSGREQTPGQTPLPPVPGHTRTSHLRQPVACTGSKPRVPIPKKQKQKIVCPLFPSSFRSGRPNRLQ